MNRFLRFGLSDPASESDTPSLYRIDKIESIVMYDQVYDKEDEQLGVFKIMLFMQDETTGILECYPYDSPKELLEARQAIRERFEEIEEVLNGA